ncbi:MAG: hypothetical protein JHD16_12195, partial [Solirubrobacteraceae bacterium]|nr:hypothetical protein [Solirubrobacteraceae bacterium]
MPREPQMNRRRVAFNLSGVPVSINTRALVRAAVGAACATALFPVPAAFAGNFTGPSTTTAPYVKSAAPGVDVTSVLTVGDTTPNGYRMVGIPDGLGVFRNDAQGVMEVTMNHELRDTQGTTRVHGQNGAFVSRYRINSNKRVYSGKDLIAPGTLFWDYVSQTHGTAPSAGGP